MDASVERRQFEEWVRLNLPRAHLNWAGRDYKHARARQLWRIWRDAHGLQKPELNGMLALLYAIREAAGDKEGRLMQDELVKHIARLRRDAEMARAAMKREAA